MTQVNWQLTPDQVAGYVVTATNWNDVASDLRAFIDQTTSSASDNTPLPLGIDLVNDRVYISDPDTTTPEDGNHADTTLSVVGTTTLAGDVTIPTSNDQILGPASGSATSGAVSYSFYNDDDTGWYRTDANQMEWATGGTARLELNTTDLTLASSIDLTVGGGDINLGTTTAAETLNVAGVTTASGAGSNLIVAGGDATGTNQGGGYLALQPGMGTGSGVSGDILLQTGPAGGSGTTANTPTTVLTCMSNGNVYASNSLTVGKSSDDGKALEVYEEIGRAHV